LWRNCGLFGTAFESFGRNFDVGKMKTSENEFMHPFPFDLDKISDDGKLKPFYRIAFK